MIAQKTSIHLSLAVVGTRVACWNLTPQKPSSQRAAERNDAVIRAWMEDDYPAIVKAGPVPQH